MSRWQVIKVLITVLYHVLVKRDYIGLLKSLLPVEPPKEKPKQTPDHSLVFNHLTRRMGRRP